LKRRWLDKPKFECKVLKIKMINLDAYQDLLAPINQFLQCSTPDEWVEEAKKPENLQTILLDHLLCELKA